MGKTVHNCLWELPPENITLLPDDVHVWCAWLDQSVSLLVELTQILSIEERMRAERYKFERDRNLFIVSRGLLRVILGYYLDIEPDRLQFRYGQYGKPALVQISGISTLRFNLAHAKGLALYAITQDREVGIDLEHIHSIAEVEVIIAHYFSDQEKTVFRGLTDEKKLETFFTYWTFKEAYLKASGEGLTRPPNEIDVLLAPGEPPKLKSINGDVQESSHWTLQELRPVPGFIAALVVERQGYRLSCWKWTT